MQSERKNAGRNQQLENSKHKIQVFKRCQKKQRSQKASQEQKVQQLADFGKLWSDVQAWNMNYGFARRNYLDLMSTAIYSEFQQIAQWSATN